MSSVAVSLSRGGLLALLGGFLVSLLILLWRSARFTQLGTALLVLFLALGLVVWFGLNQVQERLATVWKGEALEENRFTMWAYVLPLTKDFPLWGTGYGTFGYVEPLRRGPQEDPTLFWQHAHNDYLQALIEGGAVRLLLSGLAIALVFRRG